MTTYTLNDLLYAKGTSEPVRQMLLAMAENIERLEARLAQPEREWQNLTNEERLECEISSNNNWRKHSLLVEAKLKEKNNV